MKFSAVYVCAILAGLLASCAGKTSKADFYFWKTNFSLSKKEKEALNHFHSDKIYLRLFDVDLAGDSAVPLGTVQNLSNFSDSVQIVPVVFITNRTMLAMDGNSVKTLAARVVKKINALCAQGNISFSEMQFDCDWSDGSRNNYFEFLKHIKKLAGDKIRLSSTVRLHQVKYKERTGIPPADEAVIMFYNIGNVRQQNSANSILNNADASKYISHLKNYPLNFKIALPVFGWRAQYRNRKLIGLNSNETEINFNDSSRVKINSDGSYTVVSSFLSEGNYFKEGDVLKEEKISGGQLIEVSKMIRESCGNKKLSLVFFDLNEYNLKSYSYEKLEETISILN